MANTEVFIEGRQLDVSAGLDFSFNYQVSDIRNPETRQTEFSKTVRCPGTESNNALFGHIFEVTMANPYVAGQSNIGVNFNPNKKAAASVSVDTLPVFDGVMQLRRVIVMKEAVEYEVVFIGRLSNLFTRIASDRVNGTFITNETAVINGATPVYAPIIDCSDLDHEYTRNEIISTWSAPTGEGVVYPLVDYGESILYYNDGRRVYHVNDMRPAIYLKDLIDRIFAYAQSTYTCALFDTAGFKRLIVPLTAPMTLNPSEIEDRQFYADKGMRLELHEGRSLSDYSLGPITMYGEMGTYSPQLSNWAFVYRAPIPFTDDSINGYDNMSPSVGTGWGNYRVDPFWSLNITSPPPSGNYDNVNGGKWYVYYSGRYNVRVSVDMRLSEAGNVAKLQILRPGQTTYSGQIQIIRHRLGEPDLVIGQTSVSWNLGQSDPNTTVETITTQTIVASVENVELHEADKVSVAYYSDYTTSPGWHYTMRFYNNLAPPDFYDCQLAIVGGSFSNEYVNDGIMEGDTVRITRCLPDVSMRDLLVSVLRMFNLHMTPSKDIDDHYIIETWQEFYQSGTVRDWTYKLDHASPIELQPMGLLAAREYMFQYREDSDYYNDRYQSNHGRTYGSRRFEVDNDFVPKQTTVEVVFSPTPLNNDNGSNRLVSKIYDADISEGARPTDANIRVLYYAGLLTSTPSWRFRSGYPPSVGLDTLQTQYPYAGHINHPITPTFDLSWGMPFELFYGANDYISTFFYTNANLFNLYHIDQYREIIDKDSQLMTGYFHLKTTDIQKLDFRDTIIIDNQYWRLNRVMDYNPFKEGLTKIELIKALRLEPFKAVEFDGTSGGRPRGSYRMMVEQSPIATDTMRGRNGNISPSFVGEVSGFDNRIDGTATAFTVKGDRNRIGAGTSNVLIIGSDNVVGSGLHNVTIINGTGVTVSRSNVTVINGAETVLFGGIIDGSEDEVRAIGAPSPIFTIDGGEDVVSDTFADYHNDINGGSDSV